MGKIGDTPPVGLQWSMLLWHLGLDGGDGWPGVGWAGVLPLGRVIAEAVLLDRGRPDVLGELISHWCVSDGAAGESIYALCNDESSRADDDGVRSGSEVCEKRGRWWFPRMVVVFIDNLCLYPRLVQGSVSRVFKCAVL